MLDDFGSDFVTLTDEDGKEYEMEVLHTLEYNGNVYYALCPADSEDELNLEIVIMRQEEEDGESFLVNVTDEDEEEAVFERFLFETEDEEEEEE